MQKYTVVRKKQALRVAEPTKFQKLMKEFQGYKSTLYAGAGIIVITLSAGFLAHHFGWTDNLSLNSYAIEEQTLDSMDKFDVTNFSDSVSQPVLVVEDSIKEVKEVSQIEQYFDTYCAIYQVDKNLVYEKAMELTNNFTSPEWLENNQIKGTKVGGMERTYTSQELGILLFVRHVKQIPSDFGLSREELATNQTYQLDMTKEEFTEKTCNLLEHLDPILCQAIQYHETGYYQSDVFKEKNNPAGLRNGNSYWQFQNAAEGILEFAIQMEYYYLNNRDIANVHSIEEQIIEIQKSYCPLDDTRDVSGVNQYWVQSVTDIYYEIASEKQMDVHTK